MNEVSSNFPVTVMKSKPNHYRQVINQKMSMKRELTDVRQTWESTSRGNAGLHLIGGGFVSYGSVGFSFTLIGLDQSTRAVLSQSQVAIIGKPSSRSG